MEGSKIPTATFLVGENGLLQQTSGTEAMLSESIISSGTTDTIATQDNCIVKTSSCPQPTVMFTDAETVIGGCTQSSPSITIETMSNNQFLTAQTTVTNNEGALDNVLALSSSSCSTALSNAPTFTFKTASSIFDQNTSSLTAEMKDASTNFIDTIECSPMDTTATPIVRSVQNNSEVRKFFTLPHSIKKINNKFTVSGKKMGFKIIKKETMDPTDVGNEASFSSVTPNRITIKNKPMSTIPLTGVTLANAMDNTSSQAMSDICLTIDGDIGAVASAEEDGTAAAPQAPPPGSVSKLARNATLIDLNKIRKNRGHNKPLLIDEVTVMIDESDTVKVVDYGSNAPSIENYKSDFFSPIKRNSNSSVSGSNHRKKGRRRKSSWMMRDETPSAEEGGGLIGDRGSYPEDDLFCVEESLEPDADDGEPSHNQFDDTNLSVALENMRQLRVDCNVALVDPKRECIVYAHRAVLVARSPYFYKNLYLRRKRLNFLHQFCRFTLSHRINFQAVEAVVSFMYSGAVSTLFGADCDSRDVQKVLQLFEMTDVAELYAAQMPMEAPKIRTIKREPEEDHFMTHSIFNSPVAEEVTIDERKKRKKLTVSGNMSDHDRNSSVDGMNTSVTSVPGFIVNSSGEEIRMKSSVQKLVDSALTPFLCKLEELFDPNSSTMQVAKTSQHVITLWNADLLLTKLFDQNELTKYFTDYMNEVMDAGSYSSEHHTSNVGSYVVQTLTNTTHFDEEYIRVGCTDSVVPEVETLMVGEMQIINYTQMEPRHIPKYVRLIALYKFRIVIGDESNKHGGLLGPMLEEDDSTHFRTIVEGLNLREGLNGLDPKSEETTRLCFKQVSQDLSRRTIADLDVRLNVNYQEEMIMHIIVEQMEVDGTLPLVIGIFLAKGCSFCRKRECKSEDLSTPIGPDNPVCPDRQCIRKNLLCQICNKQMSSSKSLARHKYSVHDAVQGGEAGGMFICSHCGETFGKKWKLNVHEKQHEDRKLQVTCHLCNKVMRGAIALKKHINMVHETKRQFACPHCHKMFKRRETLQVHQRIHTGEKPFICSHCEYCSETKGNLKAHTWRKHKRSLLATSVGTNGVETSITGPLSTVEGMMEEGMDSVGNTNNAAPSSNGDGGGEDEADVLDGPVLELEGPVEGGGTDEHNMAASLVAHAHLQETTFMMT